MDMLPDAILLSILSLNFSSATSSPPVSIRLLDPDDSDARQQQEREWGEGRKNLKESVKRIMHSE